MPTKKGTSQRKNTRNENVVPDRMAIHSRPVGWVESQRTKFAERERDLAYEPSRAILNVKHKMAFDVQSRFGSPDMARTATGEIVLTAGS